MAKRIPLEKDIQRVILQYLQYLKGGTFWRQNAGMSIRQNPKTGNRHVFRASSIDGISDIIGVYQGYFIAIEVKRPGKKPTAKQMNFLNSIVESGGCAMWACDVEDVKTCLDYFINNLADTHFNAVLKPKNENKPI